MLLWSFLLMQNCAELSSPLYLRDFKMGEVQLSEQWEQRRACIVYAESWRKKTECQWRYKKPQKTVPIWRMYQNLRNCDLWFYSSMYSFTPFFQLLSLCQSLGSQKSLTDSRMITYDFCLSWWSRMRHERYLSDLFHCLEWNSERMSQLLLLNMPRKSPL